MDALTSKALSLLCNGALVEVDEERIKQLQQACSRALADKRFDSLTLEDVVEMYHRCRPNAGKRVLQNAFKELNVKTPREIQSLNPKDIMRTEGVGMGSCLSLWCAMVLLNIPFSNHPWQKWMAPRRTWSQREFYYMHSLSAGEKQLLRLAPVGTR